MTWNGVIVIDLNLYRLLCLRLGLLSGRGCGGGGGLGGALAVCHRWFLREDGELIDWGQELNGKTVKRRDVRAVS